MGEGVSEVTLVRWLKAEGEAVTRDEPLFELETDKVTTEALAEAEGVLLKILVEAGQTMAVGTVLGLIGQPDEAATIPEAVEAELPVTPSPTAPASPANEVEKAYSRKINGQRVSPVVARMAVEHDLDLSQIEGSGLSNRLTKDDVLAYLENQPDPPTQEARPSQLQVAPAGPSTRPLSGEVLPLTNLRRAIAEHMVLSKRTSPHVTTVFEADFAAVLAHRRANKVGFAHKGVKLTITPYLVAAIAQALQAHPLANSSWHDDGILLQRDINIGMATALEQGLIVPVIKQADELSLLGLARAVNDLAERARANQLKPDEVKGGTFTLTNHGVSGSLLATPIINQPQCGILGVGAVQKRVVVINEMIAIRPMAYLSFTFDHRILDGASADRFVAQVKQILEAWPA
jgi:2-oxoglutarate dehydrogenase E2 component (dihydrolipoamide succinyltransferase)